MATKRRSRTIRVFEDDGTLIGRQQDQASSTRRRIAAGQSGYRTGVGGIRYRETYNNSAQANRARQAQLRANALRQRSFENAGGRGRLTTQQIQSHLAGNRDLGGMYRRGFNLVRSKDGTYRVDHEDVRNINRARRLAENTARNNRLAQWSGRTLPNGGETSIRIGGRTYYTMEEGLKAAETQARNEERAQRISGLKKKLGLDNPNATYNDIVAAYANREKAGPLSTLIAQRDALRTTNDSWLKAQKAAGGPDYGSIASLRRGFIKGLRDNTVRSKEHNMGAPDPKSLVEKGLDGILKAAAVAAATPDRGYGAMSYGGHGPRSSGNMELHSRVMRDEKTGTVRGTASSRSYSYGSSDGSWFSAGGPGGSPAGRAGSTAGAIMRELERHQPGTYVGNDMRGAPVFRKANINGFEQTGAIEKAMNQANAKVDADETRAFNNYLMRYMGSGEHQRDVANRRAAQASMRREAELTNMIEAQNQAYFDLVKAAYEDQQAKASGADQLPSPYGRISDEESGANVANSVVEQDWENSQEERDYGEDDDRYNT